MSDTSVAASRLMFETLDLYDKTRSQYNILKGFGPCGATGPCGGGAREWLGYALGLHRKINSMQGEILIILFARRVNAGLP